MLAAEQITDVCTQHGEGPVWDASTGLLRWVDMLRGDVLSLATASGTPSRRHVGTVAAALRPRRSGGMVLALERGFAIDDTRSVRVLPELWTQSTIRMNDGGCDPQGRFYCGSMAYDSSPGQGALYRLDPDGAVHTVLTGVTISNGLAWSPDGATVYYIDSATRRVDAFDFNPVTGGFGDRRTVVEISAEHGMPDGMTVDADGGLWVALWGGGAVHRYTPHGRLDAVVTLPVSQVSACTFGGPTHTDLFITTSRQGVPDGEQPPAGALFRVQPGLAGLPAATFAG